jgi:hypothetical protein
MPSLHVRRSIADGRALAIVPDFANASHFYIATENDSH